MNVATVNEDKAIVGGLTVDTYAIDVRPGVTHWVERISDEAGRVSSVMVKHPDGSRCELHRDSTPSDWLVCAAPAHGRPCRFACR